MAPDENYEPALEERSLLLIRRKGDSQKITDHDESCLKEAVLKRLLENYRSR